MVSDDFMDHEGLSVDELLGGIVCGSPGSPANSEAVSIKAACDPAMVHPSSPAGSAGVSTTAGETCSASSSSGARRCGRTTNAKRRQVDADGGVEAGSDIPEMGVALPPEVVLTNFQLSISFSVGCPIDVKKVAFGVRVAEFNPRKQSALILRLIDPKITARVTADGGVCCLYFKGCEDVARQAAGKIARMIQKCGHPNAKVVGFRVSQFKASSDLRFPVRLDSLAEKWRRNVMYEPEVYSGLCFYMTRPRCTLKVVTSGKLELIGCSGPEEATEVLRRLYPIFREFSR